MGSSAFFMHKMASFNFVFGAPKRQKKILVLGSGVVGLNTALRLQTDHPEAEITIMAEKFDSELVSYVAAGFYRAGPKPISSSPELTKEWLKNSWNYYKHLKETIPQQETGIVDVPTYILTSKQVPPTNLDDMKEISFVRKCSQAELDLFLPAGKYIHGFFMKTMTISPEYYLPWAMSRFKAQNGKFVQRRIDSWDDFIDDKESFDVIINCTGLGAKKLCNDAKMSPIRGQVIRVKAPWIKFAAYADNDTYIIPGMDYVTLGGCRQYDNYNKDIDLQDSRGIWQRTTSLIPTLKKSQIVCEAVGLRPFRTAVRVEKESKVLSNGSKLNIVHHYGHCGYGVLASPGSAITVSQLVNEILAGN